MNKFPQAAVLDKNKNFMRIDWGSVTTWWFSNTPVAFRVGACLVVRENEWGWRNEELLNMIDGGAWKQRLARVDFETFERLWRKLITPPGRSWFYVLHRKKGILMTHDRKPDVSTDAFKYGNHLLSFLFLKLSSEFEKAWPKPASAHASNCRNEGGERRGNKIKVRRDVAVAICELCWFDAAGWSDQQLAENVGEVAYRFKCGEFVVEDQALAEELCKLAVRFDEEIEVVSAESEPSDNRGMKGGKAESHFDSA